ncbi:MAG: hypothetical protein J5527_10835 [Treponema sp.]|nr:hypothetical protein [Treponema sp.]
MKFRFVISVLLFFLCTSLYSKSPDNDDSQITETQYVPLQTNYNLTVGYNIDPKFTHNYFQGKLMVDLAEGWFNRFGFLSAIGGEIGFSQNDTNSSSFIATLYAPGLGFSYRIFKGLVASTGVYFTQTWYRTKEVNDLITVNTLVYSNGLAVPVNIRYYFNDYIAVLASANFMFHPWVPIQNENGKNSSIYDVVTQVNIGVTFSVPSRQL